MNKQTAELCIKTLKDNEEQQQKSNAWGTAALISGIASMPLVFMPYFGLPISIFGIVAYAIQQKNHSNGMATAGLILSILGCMLNLAIVVMLLFVLWLVRG